VNEFEKAANVLNLLRGVTRAAEHHPFMASLYAPLVAADMSEARHRMKETGSPRAAILPGLAGLALAAMMATHLADPVSKFLQKRNLQTGGDIASHLLSGAKGFLKKD